MIQKRCSPNTVSDTSNIVGAVILAIGAAHLFWPKGAISFRNRIPRAIRRFDPAEWIVSSKYGELFVRVSGLFIMLFGVLVIVLYGEA